MAAQACGTPIAILNLIDGDRQWFVAGIGLGVRQMRLSPSFCTEALGATEILVIPDTRADHRLADHPLVQGPPFVRFYASVPLRTPQGLPVGVLGVLDQQPRQVTTEQVIALKALAHAVMARLEQHKAIAERDLALSQERRAGAHSQQILNSAIDYAIISFDLNGRVSSWNTGAQRILGWDETEMLGQLADRFFTPEDAVAGRPAAEMREAAQTGRGNDERWHMRRDGTRFFASGEMMALRDDAGALTGFLKILRDRTEQRRATLALRDSQERVEAALGTGLVAFFDWDVSGDRIRGDERYAAFHGLDPAHLAEGAALAELLDVIHPDDRQTVHQITTTAVEERGDYTKRYRIWLEGRQARTLMIRGSCYEADGKRGLRFTGIAIDISATEEAEAALRESEAFNRQVLASSSDCIKVLGLDGSLQFMSEGGLRALGIDDPAAVIGLPWPDLWDSAEKARALAALAEARAGGCARFEGDASTLGGTRRYWNVVITPMRSANGPPERLLAISRDVTEARSAVERIELALDAGAVLGTWMWDIARDHVIADVRFARTFSLDPDGLAAGLPLARVLTAIHPDERAGVEALVGHAMARGGQYSAEYRVRQPDGTWRWVQASGHCDLDDAGRPIRFPGVLIDIDSRKRHEIRQEALILLGNRLRGLQDPSAIAAVASEVLGETLGVGRASYGRVIAAHELVEVDCDWRAVPEMSTVAGCHHFRNFGSYIEDLKRNGVVAIPDVAVDPRTRANAGRFAAIQVRALLNVPLMEKGKLAAIMFAHRTDEYAWPEEEIAFTRAVADRTWAALEQAQAEAGLRLMNATLEQQVATRTQERDAIWHASQDLLGVADPNGIWLSVNPAWTENLGWSPEEIIGRTSEWLEHPDDCARTRAELYRLASGQRTVDFENRFRTRDGSYRALSWVGVPVEGKLYCAARDVTEQKAAAEQLAQTEEQLRQSQKMEAVGQLTGGLAHDFNNLLAGVTGNLELMQTRLGQGRFIDVERHIAAAHGAARRAAALTHRLLAFSRRQTLDPKPVDVNRLVADMEDLIRRTVGPAITVETAGAIDLWATLVDPGQLESALLNLCINARDALPDGGQITVETGNQELDERAARRLDLPAGQYVTLGVSDTGTGMSPAVVERAFEPFFTTKPIGQGTGLGLSMVYGFARQSDGQVRIQSEFGHGTNVCLYLPRHVGPGQAAEAAPELANAPRAERGETVLVVEDEPTIRTLVAEVLEDLGYTAIEASDGAAGLKVLQSNARIDLLVTDVGLPGSMNGRQVADAARVARPGMKVLFITGYAENAVLGHGNLEPGMHVMTKPFAMEALASRIRELLAL